MSSFSRCSLDANGCLNLSSILQAFNAAVSEEQAWAVCFQSAKTMINEWNNSSANCFCLSETSHVLIHKDGYIHKSTVKVEPTDADDRELAASEYQLVATLGMVVFSALDYLMPVDEERKLTRPLESLIEQMTATHPGGHDGDFHEDSQNADDEGIEQDSGEDDSQHTIMDEDGKPKSGLSLTQVMELCAGHLSLPEEADCHYKAVCRALVAEVLELTTFLEKISNRTQILSTETEGEDQTQTLEKLKLQDWARLWMQVIYQLRQGVKLKKVDAAQFHPIEYALTPYEMLLDDIRSRRYKLRQVMVNGDIPTRVKKDAHALILEFIRSRPPLVPVSKRKLPPSPPRTLTLYDKLMASIRQQHKLKPTPTRNAETIKARRRIETSRTKLNEKDSSPQPQRRLIKPHINLGTSSSFEDLDDDLQTPDEPKPSRKSSILRRSSSSASNDSADRRHSISVCESPPRSSVQTPTDHFPPNNPLSAFYQHSSRTRSEFWRTSQWQSLECLSLTLDEVVHIRNVLTKAELESLIVKPSLYEDVRKGKVCFTCKVIRFSFFGPWGTKCKMCERTVCDKCCTKMRIPTEHFARIPVYMLSPTPSPPPEEESSHSPFWKFSEVFGKSEAKENVESTSKLQRQKTTAITESSVKRRLNFRHSESICSTSSKKERKNSTQRKRAPLQRSKTLVSDNNTVITSSKEFQKGPEVPICRECKVMVRNIIQASQDSVCFDDHKRRGSKSWFQKKGSIATTSFMEALNENAGSSPDEEDVFELESKKNTITP